MKTTKHTHRPPIGHPPTEAEIHARFRATAAAVRGRLAGRPAVQVDRGADAAAIDHSRRLAIAKRARRSDPPS